MAVDLTDAVFDGFKLIVTSVTIGSAQNADVQITGFDSTTRTFGNSDSGTITTSGSSFELKGGKSGVLTFAQSTNSSGNPEGYQLRGFSYDVVQIEPDVTDFTDFAFYRWTPLKMREGNEVQLAQFTFFNEGEDLLATRRASGDPMPILTGPEPLDNRRLTALIDGNLTRSQWFASGVPFEPVTFQFNESIRIDGYMMWTAGDLPHRDPISWTLEGSNDGSDWAMLASVKDNPTPENRNTRYLETGQFAIGQIEEGADVKPGLSFEDWLDIQFPDEEDRKNPELVDQSAAPAGDGMANLMKYAFGFEALTPVAGADLRPAKVEDGVITLSYRERVGATGISYLPEKSFNLIDWDSEGIQQVSSPQPDGEFKWVTIELELNEEVRAFLRIQVNDLLFFDGTFPERGPVAQTWTEAFERLGPIAGAPPRENRPELEGKVVTGYQGWFGAEGDGSGMGWRHYGGGATNSTRAALPSTCGPT